MSRYVGDIDRWASRRSVVYAPNAIVASNQPLASSAGLDILRQGGTAADAAIAVAAALNVLEPYSTGLGGDAFWIYFDGSTKSVHAVNGSGFSPAGLSFESAAAVADDTSRIPEGHPLAVTVPGAPAAWQMLHDEFGRLPRRSIVRAAVDFAEHGFPVAPVTAHLWRKFGEPVLDRTRNGKELLIDRGRGPMAGQVVRLPGLAESLRIFGEEGATPFYHGPLADRIVDAVREEGGVLSLDDMAAFAVERVQPVGLPYGDQIIYELPPNGQGIVALIALGILRESRLNRHTPSGVFAPTVDALHAQIEAVRIAFAIGNQYIGDPIETRVSPETLLSEERLTEWAEGIGPNRGDLAGLGSSLSPGSGSDTVYFSVGDQYGNVCSFINSIFTGFGSGIVPRGTGFALQNRGRGFLVKPEHPNAPGPRKRAYHTIIPGLSVGPDEEVTAFGVMGGYMQPQGHVQVISSLIDSQLDPQSSLDRPRFYVENGRPDGEVWIEDSLGGDTVQDLRQRGHSIEIKSGRDRTVFGLGQITSRRSGVWIGGSDPRGDGGVVGY